jgi:hypothetical protein
LAASDAKQLAFSFRERRVMLTHNRVDFEKLSVQYFEDQTEHAGLVIAARRMPNDIVHRLLPILNTVDAEEMVNQIRYI